MSLARIHSLTDLLVPNADRSVGIQYEGPSQFCTDKSEQATLFIAFIAVRTISGGSLVQRYHVDEQFTHSVAGGSKVPGCSVHRGPLVRLAGYLGRRDARHKGKRFRQPNEAKQAVLHDRQLPHRYETRHEPSLPTAEYVAAHYAAANGGFHDPTPEFHGTSHEQGHLRVESVRRAFKAHGTFNALSIPEHYFPAEHQLG